MNSKTSTPVFPVGGQYAPVIKATEAPLRDWDRDIRQLRDLGMTAFRAFVAWDRIEREEGMRDFSMIDHALSLAEKYDLGVLVNVGGVFDNLAGMYPPQWLVQEYAVQHPLPDSRMTAATPRPSGTRYRVCADDPLYRERAESFLIDAIRHIARSPVLIGWGVWNEPHLDPCYCPHTVARFRQWVRQRYEDLEAVAEAWSREYPVRLRTWDDVTPPAGVGFLEGGYAPWIDWELFRQQSVTENVRRIHDLAKAHDPRQRPTTCNLTIGEIAGSGIRRGVDPWAIGQTVDVAGYSAYTIRDRGEHTAARRAAERAAMRAVSRAEGGRWNVIETEAGPVNWISGLAPAHTPLDDRILRHWQAIAHGARMIMGWMYRSRVANAQAGEFGMLGWDGGVTERAKAHGELSRLLQSHADTLMQRYNRADVAVLTPSSSMLLYASETRKSPLTTSTPYFATPSWYGAYAQLWRLGIQADFVDEQALIGQELGDYKVLLLPFMLAVTEELARGIEHFVAQGGTVVADFPLGMKNDTGDHWQRIPGAGLASLFGGWSNDALPNAGDVMSFGDGRQLPEQVFRQAFIADQGADVLAQWQDGQPAAIAKATGKGRAILIGTLFFMEAEGDNPQRQLLRDWLAQAGVWPTVEVTSEDPDVDTTLVEVVPLYPRNARRPDVFVVLNHSGRDVALSLTLPDEYADVFCWHETEFEHRGRHLQCRLAAKAAAVFQGQPTNGRGGE